MLIMVAPSPPLALASQSTELLLTLVATALRSRKALVTSTASDLLVAEVLKFALPLPASHRDRQFGRRTAVA
jgi:hypothetical protein